MTDTVLGSIGNMPNEEQGMRDFYSDPSSVGSEEFELVRPPHSFYGDTGISDEVSLKNLPIMLTDKLTMASEAGDLHKVLSWYSGALSVGDLLDARSVQWLKSLAKEANEARFDEAKTQIVFKKAKSFIAGLKPARRK